MLEKSGNFAHASELVKNLRLIWVSEVGVATGSTAPPINIQRSAPRATFHVHVRKSVHLCNLTIPTKSLQVQNQKPNRKSAILNFFSSYFVGIFAIFRCHTLTNSSQRCIQMNTKIGQCNLKPFVTLNCEDLEFSSEGVSVASCQILMFRMNRKLLYLRHAMSDLHQTSTSLIDS